MCKLCEQKEEMIKRVADSVLSMIDYEQVTKDGEARALEKGLATSAEAAGYMFNDGFAVGVHNTSAALAPQMMESVNVVSELQDSLFAIRAAHAHSPVVLLVLEPLFTVIREKMTKDVETAKGMLLFKCNKYGISKSVATGETKPDTMIVEEFVMIGERVGKAIIPAARAGVTSEALGRKAVTDFAKTYETLARLGAAYIDGETAAFRIFVTELSAM